jgi:hypothetical protein
MQGKQKQLNTAQVSSGASGISANPGIGMGFSTAIGIKKPG